MYYDPWALLDYFIERLSKRRIVKLLEYASMLYEEQRNVKQEPLKLWFEE
jgi:hypothetical protein